MGIKVEFVVIPGKGTQPTQMYYNVTQEIPKMVQLEPGTVLEKKYKGNVIKVKVLKDGSFSYNGKTYEDRSSLMKAILKGKTGQFTNFFKIGKSANGNSDAPKRSKKVTIEDVSEVLETMDDANAVTNALDTMIRNIVREEISNIFRGGNNA